MLHVDHQTMELPDDFVPTPYTVIVGRGRETKTAIGNKRLRVLAVANIEKYASAKVRSVKSGIVSMIVGMIHDSPGGMFVKQDRVTGRWSKVDDSVAREKVGYIFRDLLSDQYRSSSKSKVARRNSEQYAAAAAKLQSALRRTKSDEICYSPAMDSQAIATESSWNAKDSQSKTQESTWNAMCVQSNTEAFDFDPLLTAPIILL